MTDDRPVRLALEVGHLTRALRAAEAERDALRAQVANVRQVIGVLGGMSPNNESESEVQGAFVLALYAALGDAEAPAQAEVVDGWICEVCGCWNRDGDLCKYGDDEAHQAEEQ